MRTLSHREAVTSVKQFQTATRERHLHRNQMLKND